MNVLMPQTSDTLQTTSYSRLSQTVEAQYGECKSILGIF